MNTIKRYCRKAFGYCLSRLSKNRYIKWIGLNYGKDIHIYGNPMNMFGTEPWCITLGNHVHITEGVKFITHDGGTLIYRHLIPDLEITKPIKVGDYVYFGTRSMIMPGVTIGNNCIIAAGAIVTKDVPNNSVVGGVPAKIIKSSNDYFDKIKTESLHLGHLKGNIKDKALKKYYGYSKGNEYDKSNDKLS